MPKHLFAIPDWQSDQFRQLKEQTGLTMNEIHRRAMDYIFRPHVMNELIPSFSGNIQIERR